MNRVSLTVAALLLAVATPAFALRPVRVDKVITTSKAAVKDARRDHDKTRDTRTVTVRPVFAPSCYDPSYSYYNPFLYGLRAAITVRR